MSLWVVLEGIWIRSETVNIASLSIRPSYGAGGEEILDGGGGRGRRDLSSFFASIFPLFPRNAWYSGYNIAGYQMRLLVWRVVNKTLKFRLTFLIVMLTINSRSPWEKISGFNLRLTTWDETQLKHAYLRAMLTVSDRIQIPSWTTHKETGTKVIRNYISLFY